MKRVLAVLAIAFPSFFVFLLFILVIIETCNYPKLTIQPISVPPDFETKGYTPNGIAHRLNDSIQLSLGASHTFWSRQLGIQTNPIPLEAGFPVSDIILPAFGKSIKSIATYVALDLFASFMPYRLYHPRIVVGGELYFFKDNCVGFQLRIGQGDEADISFRTPGLCDIRNDKHLDELFDNAADRMIERSYKLLTFINPCGLGLFYLNKFQLSKSIRHKMKAEEVMSFIHEKYAKDSRQVACAINLKGAFYIVEANEEEGNEDRYDDAIKQFVKAAQIDPDSVMAYMYCGYALFFKNHYYSAIKQFQKVISIDSTQIRAHIALGFIYKILGNRASEGNRREEAAKQYENSVNQYMEAASLFPQSTSVYHNWGDLLRDMDKLEEAIKKYEKAVEINPEEPRSRLYLGLALADLGEYEDAIRQYKMAVEFDPGYYEAYHQMGHAFADSGHHSAAIEQYARAVKLNRTYSHVYGHLGNELARKGACEAAARKYKKALRFDEEFKIPDLQTTCPKEPQLPL